MSDKRQEIELEVEAEHHLLARQQVIQIYELKLIMFLTYKQS